MPSLVPIIFAFLAQGDAQREEAPLAPPTVTVPSPREALEQLKLEADADPDILRAIPALDDRDSVNALWKTARNGVLAHLPTYEGTAVLLHIGPTESPFTRIPGLGVVGEY